MSFTDGAFYEVRQEITSILKIYPTSFAEWVIIKEPFDFRRYDFDQKRIRLDEDKKRSKTEEDPEETEKHSRWRAKTKIIDLALANEFDLFPTFTFKENRYDVDALKRQMSVWLNNQRVIRGPFRYIIVPEYHKRCEDCVNTNNDPCSHPDAPKAIHFHALFGGYEGNLVDRGHKDKHGRTKYDIDSFQLGISTAIKIDPSLDDRMSVAGYVSKYMTKEMPKFHGKQRYWRSNGLLLPVKILNPLLTEQDKERFQVTYDSKTKTTLQLRGELTAADIERISNYGGPREDDLRVVEW